MNRRLTVVFSPALVLAMLMAVLPPGGSYVDDDGNVHEGGIEAIAAEGITQGCDPPANDRYCPDRTVTRAQMAVFLARALHLPDTANDYFGDDEGHVLEGGRPEPSTIRRPTRTDSSTTTGTYSKGRSRGSQ